MTAWVHHQNFRAWATTAAGAASYVGLCAVLGRRRLLPERLSRKMMHIGTGPLYVLCWPLYTASTFSPWLCASVPLLASLQFLLVGSGALADVVGLVPAATRSGQRQELLRGPLLYGLSHVAITLLLWQCPAAVVSIAVLCGGDGLAEVVGRSVHSPPLPWNRNKTVAGSVACASGGALLALPLLHHFVRSSATTLSGGSHVLGVLACAVVAALVESLPLPVEGGDNVTVPLAAILASKLMLGA